MNRFDYKRVNSPEEAGLALAADPSARVISGGTDLLPLMKEGIVAPLLLLDLSGWQSGNHIEEGEGGLTIGANTPLAAIASHPVVMEYYSALADACRLAAAPQLRNMGTLGGNLLQQTRCWYYRGDFNCWLKGGDTCFARSGENEQHAIFNTNPRESMCASAHPSDPAAALLALEATVEYVTHNRRGTLKVEDFYRLPTDEQRGFTSLPPGAVIASINLPLRSNEHRSIYRKAMPRATWAFALAGVALSARLDGDLLVDVRVALSGVAPVPVRIEAAEAALNGLQGDTAAIDEVARLLTASAAPLAKNGYKIELLQGLFKQAFAELVSL